MIIRAVFRCFVLLVVALLLAGCEHLQPKKISQSGIWDGFRNGWITEEQFTKGLGDADYIIVGDLQHTASLGHQLMPIMTSMRKRGTPELLALDILPATYMHERKKPAEHVFLEKVNTAVLEKYKPMFEWADSEGVTIIGTALPPEQLTSLKNEDARKKLAEKTEGSLTRDGLRELSQSLGHAHQSGRLPVDYLVAVHQFKDYAMADRLMSEGKKALLVTRAFQARLDLGVNRYIKARNPRSSVKSVLMYSSSDDRIVASPDFKEMKSWYDYIWVNPGGREG